MRKEFITSLEKAANATFCFVISNRWLAIRLDFVVLFFSISIAAFAVGFRAIYPSSLLAYTLQVTSDLIAFFSFSLRSFAELQNFMTSAQRLIRYTKLESEGDFETPYDKKLSNWPSKGKVEFDDVSLKYREDFEFAIKDVNFTVYPSQKFGIVGRSGAGKSTIL